MQIILLRHGTRDYGVGDQPLNQEGLEEATELSKNPVLLQASTLFASPKKRAQMTLAPLSEALQIPITIEKKLDQHLPHESEQAFSQRVKTFIDNIPSLCETDKTYVFCSHSDWLSFAMEHIPSDELSLGPSFFQCAEFISFQVKDGLWTL